MNELRKAESELEEGLRLGALLWPRKMAAELRRLHEENQALRQALEQPEQEPVAWIHNMIEGGFTTKPPVDLTRHPERWTALYSEPKPCPTCEALARAVMMDQTAYDIAPPKREWVGLTDQEIKEGADLSRLYKDQFEPVARWAEAKLKDKNDGNL